jgi:hypothetical protein
MKNFVFYSVAGSVIGIAGHAAGLGLGTVLALSLVTPPLLIIARIVLQARGIERKTHEEYWLRHK